MLQWKRNTWWLAVAFAALPAVAVRGGEDWTSRVIQLERESDQTAPPVATAVSLQPGGSLVAVAGDDHSVQVWNRDSGQLVYRLTGHGDWVRAVAFAPDGATLASAGNDGRIVLWDAQNGRKLRILAQHEHIISSLVYSHDGKRLAATGFEDMLRIYDTQTGDQLLALDCPCRDMRAIAYSPDGTTIAAGGRNGKIRFWSTVDGGKLNDQVAHRQRVRAIVFSPTGNQIASCGDDGAVRIATVRGDTSYELPRRPTKVMSLTYLSPDSLATGGSDNLIRLWDLTTRQEVGRLEGHTGSVVALAAQDGVLCSGGYDTTIRVWQSGSSVADGRLMPPRRGGDFRANGFK